MNVWCVILHRCLLDSLYCEEILIVEQYMVIFRNIRNDLEQEEARIIFRRDLYEHFSTESRGDRDLLIWSNVLDKFLWGHLKT